MDEQISQRCRELVFDERRFQSQQVQRAAIVTAMNLIGWPALVLLIARIAAAPLEQPVLGLLCGIIVVAIMTVTVGASIGWLAHRLFWGTTIPVNRMAVAMAILFDVTIFGWVLIIIN